MTSNRAEIKRLLVRVLSYQSLYRQRRLTLPASSANNNKDKLGEKSQKRKTCGQVKITLETLSLNGVVFL